MPGPVDADVAGGAIKSLVSDVVVGRVGRVTLRVDGRVAARVVGKYRAWAGAGVLGGNFANCSASAAQSVTIPAHSSLHSFPFDAQMHRASDIRSLRNRL